MYIYAYANVCTYYIERERERVTSRIKLRKVALTNSCLVPRLTDPMARVTTPRYKKETIVMYLPQTHRRNESKHPRPGAI